jgi:hypothetical protein
MIRVRCGRLVIRGSICMQGRGVNPHVESEADAIRYIRKIIDR